MATLCMGSVAGGYTKIETPWTALSNDPLNDGQTYGFPFQIKWVNDRFVILFYTDSTSSVKRIYTHTDPKSGTAWTGYTTPSYLERVHNIEYYNSMYVLTGTGSQGAVIATTTDFVTYTKRHEYSASEYGGLFIHGGYIWAYGQNYGGSTHTLWRSANGTAWDTWVSTGYTHNQGPRAHALFSAQNRVVLFSASGSYIFYQEMNLVNGNVDTQDYIRAQYGSYPGGESGAGLSGVGADTTNGWVWAIGGGQFWRKPIKAVNSSAVGGAWDYSYGYNPYDDAPRTANGYDRYIGIKDNMHFVNGKMITFGRDARLHVLTPSSWQNGNQTSGGTASTNLPTAAGLGSVTITGGVYSPTLDYWIAIGMGDYPTMSYSKKYNKIMWTNKPFFA